MRTVLSRVALGNRQTPGRLKAPTILTATGFGLKPILLEASVAGMRRASSIETGHIHLEKNEGLIFINSKYSYILWYGP